MIIGHKKQISFLKKMARDGSLAHAMIFSGEEQLGKKTIAIEIAKDCKVDVKSPDLIFISPQGKEITVFQIKDLIWKLSLKPYCSPFKIAIIDNSHLMNSEAQNSFLKTIEEPKGKSLIFLITEYPEKLLPTISSRCQAIKFYPVLENDLKQISKDDDLISLSFNRPGRLVELMENKEKLEECKRMAREIKEIEKSDFSEKFQYAKKIAEDEKLKTMLEIWLSYFRKKLLKENNFEKNKKIINLIQSINYWTTFSNINPKLALEILMMEI